MPKRMTLKFNQKGLYRLLVTVFWVMIACVFSSLIHGQSAEVQGFSLQSAQEFAVEHSYDIKRSQMDVLTAEKKVRETTYSGFPQLNSTINYINNLELMTVLIPNFFDEKLDEKIPVQFGTRHNVSAGFTLTQLLSLIHI